MLTSNLTPNRAPHGRRNQIAAMIEESILDGYRDELYAMQDDQAHAGEPIAALSVLVRDLPRSSGLDGVTDEEIERALGSIGGW